MFVKRNYSIAIVDVEKIDEINKIILKYASSIQEFSTHLYFNLDPLNVDDIYMDISLFKLESESESSLDKKLNDLVEDLNQLNTGYSIRDEDSKEMIVEIEYVMALYIKFDNVKFIEEGTYEKIDEFNHLKTEFGVCKNYNPPFRSIENISIENTEVQPETIYLFADNSEDISKLKAFVSEKIMEINPDFEIEFDTFKFRD